MRFLQVLSTSTSRFLKLFLASILVTLTATVAQSQPKERIPLSTSYRPLPANTTFSSTVDLGAQMYLLFFVKHRNYEELNMRIRRGPFPSLDELNARFYPTPADYQKLRQWLERQGLVTTQAGPEHHRQFLEVRGTVAKVANALQIDFCQVRPENSQRSYVAACTIPTLPSDIANLVQYIDGLQPYEQTLQVQQGVSP